MDHLYKNLIGSIDVETTGTLAGHHEIIQIGIVPLGHDLKPLDGWRPFYTNVKPEFPERLDPKALEISGLSLEELADAPSQDRAVDLLDEWFETLPLPVDGRLIPLAHNAYFERDFLRAWLGIPGMEQYFHYLFRDAMICALAIKDKMALEGLEPPFDGVSLTNLCKVYGITNTKAHDALADAYAEAELYRTLLGAK